MDVGFSPDVGFSRRKTVLLNFYRTVYIRSYTSPIYQLVHSCHIVILLPRRHQPVQGHSVQYPRVRHYAGQDCGECVAHRAHRNQRWHDTWRFVLAKSVHEGGASIDLVRGPRESCKHQTNSNIKRTGDKNRDHNGARDGALRSDGFFGQSGDHVESQEREKHQRRPP